MGASESTPSCPECNCESEVPRVLSACNNAVDSSTRNTLVAAMKSLVGQESTDFLLSEYQNTNENGNLLPNLLNKTPIKWNKDHKNTRETFNNFEGFIEGNENNDDECVPCDCREAADNIIKRCQDSSKQTTSTLAKVIDPSIVPNETRTAIQNGLNNATGNESTTTEINVWKNISYPGLIQKTEPMTNIKEGFDTGLYKFTRDALESRHATFKNTSQFIEDCKTNSYNSIKNFINDEKNDLDKLYNYYETFLKDYESLYLHRESTSKIIYNKLDELEKIQSKINNYKKNLHVDNRKNNYQSSNYDFYKNIYFYMLIIYYSLFVLYLIFSKFISEKQYNNKKILLILFLYLITPIILGYLINFIYQGYIYLLEYNNLKEDTKSYVDIVNNK